MIGALITLSIVSFVLLCTTIMLWVAFRIESNCNGLAQTLVKNYEHTLDRLTQAIEGLEACLRTLTVKGINTK